MLNPSQSKEKIQQHKEELIPSTNWGEENTVDLHQVESNFQEILKNIAHYKVKIVAVTKYFGLDAIIAGYKVGIRDFGESRAIESIAKIEKLPKEIRTNSTFHFIGHLQTNKVEKVVSHFDIIESVDSLKLAKAISNAACRLNKKEKIFLQVNNAEEIQKSGYSKQQLKNDIKEIISLPNLEIVGLMNIAPFDIEERELQKLFCDIRQFRDELEKEFSVTLRELSMGMSNDYKIALKEGATVIRIGRKLFK